MKTLAWCATNQDGGLISVKTYALEESFECTFFICQSNDVFVDHRSVEVSAICLCGYLVDIAAAEHLKCRNNGIKRCKSQRCSTCSTKKVKDLNRIVIIRAACKGHKLRK